MRSLALFVLALFAVLGGWFFLGASDAVPVEGGVVPVASGVDSSPLESDADLDLADAAGLGRKSVEAAAAEGLGSGLSVGARDEDHPWAKSMAGVTGRVLEADGSPAAGLAVVLMQFDVSTVIDQDSVASPLEGLDVGSARTDADGRFVFSGARAAGMHGLSIDAGGPRATVRFIDQSLAHQKVTDVGDFTLESYGTVTGVVIDEDGEPVVGARVRLAVVPDIVVQSGALALNARSKLLMAQEARVSFGEAPVESKPQVTVLEVPQFLMELERRLPFSTGSTGSDGSFRIEGVPTGRVSGGVDLAGFVPTVVSSFELGEGETHDLEELELVIGRTVTGRVVDGTGEPVAGVPVYAGTMSPLIPLAILGGGELSAEDGSFEVAGVSEMGEIAVAAIRPSGEASGTGQLKADVASRWASMLTRQSSGIELALASGAPLTIEVHDVDGEPVPSAQIQIEHVGSGGGMSTEADFFAFSGRHPKIARATSPEAGTYVVDGVSLGNLELAVTAPGYIAEVVRCEHSRESVDGVQVTMKRGRVVRVTALDADTQEPVPAVHVSIIAPYNTNIMTLGSGWTGPDGAAEAGQVPQPGQVSLVNRRIQLFFEHPSYGSHGATLDELQQVGATSGPVTVDQVEGELALTIRLETSGGIDGRVTWAGEAPEDDYMALILPGDERGQGLLPRFAATRRDGTFHLSGLAPGSYELQLMAREFSGNPLAFFESMPEGETLYGQTVLVEPGQMAAVEITLLAAGEAPPDRIQGSVLVDGVPWAGSVVSVNGQHIAVTDASGSFAWEGADFDRWANLKVYPPGEEAPESRPSTRSARGSSREVAASLELVAKVSRDAPAKEEILTLKPIAESIEIQPGGLTQVDIVLETLSFEVQCIDDGTGLPLAEVELSGSFEVPTRPTDEEGRTTLEIRRRVSPAANSRRRTYEELRASLTGYATRSIPIADLSAKENALEIRMKAVVPCGGVLLLPDGALEDQGRGYLNFQPAPEKGRGSTPGRGASAGTSIRPDGEFSVDGLAPGDYRFAIYLPSMRRRLEGHFTLPPGGSTSLQLEFD